ncbi:MAG TPA: hypothetical protein VL985_05390 [Stellaceae bacterium]|nr:hypothetical protein [Stellaceae bacterium]
MASGFSHAEVVSPPGRYHQGSTSVVGRPIVKSADPATAAAEIIARLRTFIGQVMTETSGFVTPGRAHC